MHGVSTRSSRAVTPGLKTDLKHSDAPSLLMLPFYTPRSHMSIPVYWPFPVSGPDRQSIHHRRHQSCPALAEPGLRSAGSDHCGRDWRPLSCPPVTKSPATPGQLRVVTGFDEPEHSRAFHAQGPQPLVSWLTGFFIALPPRSFNASNMLPQDPRNTAVHSSPRRCLGATSVLFLCRRRRRCDPCRGPGRRAAWRRDPPAACR